MDVSLLGLRVQKTVCRALGIAGPTLCKLLNKNISIKQPSERGLHEGGMYMDEEDFALICPAFCASC